MTPSASHSSNSRKTNNHHDHKCGKLHRARQLQEVVQPLLVRINPYICINLRNFFFQILQDLRIRDVQLERD